MRGKPEEDLRRMEFPTAPTRRTRGDCRVIRKADEHIRFGRLELVSLDGLVSGWAKNALESGSGGSRAFSSENVL